MKSLLLFSIGPVQDFIAASRRMKDLSNGSHLLSYLASRAVRVLRHSQGDASLIFPAVDVGGLADLDKGVRPTEAMAVASIPNRILAVVDSDKVSSLAEAMETAIRNELESISEFILGKAEDAFLDTDIDMWRRSIADALEVQWVAAQISESDLGNADKYQEAYHTVNRAMGMRKYRREFHSLNGSGYACSLAANLSAVQPLDPAKLEPRAYGDFVRALNEQLGRRFRDMFPNGNGDTADDTRESKQWNERLSPLSYVKRLYSSYLKATYGLDLGRFDSPEDIAGRGKIYYSVLLMDGDRMGVRLSAAGMGLDGHRDLSRTLYRFATEAVPKQCSEYGGLLLYAGGDDVLALLPTEAAVRCAEAIRTEFAEMIQGATMSAGIAVVHIQHPLREAFDDARRAERKAKDGLGRDAVAFRIVKRSGEILQSGTGWQHGDRGIAEFLDALRPHLVKPVKGFRNGLSYKWLQDLTQLSYVADGIPEEAVVMEMKRLFERHIDRSNSDIRDIWRDHLQPWYSLMSSKDDAMDAYIRLIDTAYYLARGTDQ
jgi:CRISPR-associated protein Cmr2